MTTATAGSQLDDHPDHRLACPDCGSTDLATLENIEGVARAEFFVSGAIEHDGYTEVLWDTSTTFGVACKECRWDAMDDDPDANGSAVNFLVPENLGEETAEISRSGMVTEPAADDGAEDSLMPHVCAHCEKRMEADGDRWVHRTTKLAACSTG
jgi:hypothetical protein